MVMLFRFIIEDDSGGESEIKEGKLFDWELYFLDKMSDDEKSEQFDDTQQPIVKVRIHKLLKLSLKYICYMVSS